MSKAEKIKKLRIDQILVNRAMVQTRTRAISEIMSANVLVNEVPVTKPGTKVKEDAAIRFKKNPDKYVSRSAHKLLAALEAFRIEPTGKCCMDIGASTGGFTQVLLEAGAEKVYSIDVGTNQLAWEIRNDSRVVSIENTNARNMPLSLVEIPVDVMVMDVSFISVRKILPNLKLFLRVGGELIILVKPQFEAGKESVEKGGLVNDRKVHREVIDNVRECAGSLGFVARGEIPSPILGTKGNQEYLLYLSLEEDCE